MTENTVDHLNVDCLADGYPQPTISWKIGENILTPVNGSVKSALWKHGNGFKGTYRVLSNGTLSIHGYYTRAPASQDYFLCIAKNAIKEVRKSYSFVFEKCKYTIG